MSTSETGAFIGPAQVISTVATAVLGLAAFVYLAGAAVLWARLRAIHVPADRVVAILPRELLIATGLRTVVLPSVLLAVVAAVVILVNSQFETGGDRPRGVGSWLGLLASALVLLLISLTLLRGLLELSGYRAVGWTIALFLTIFVAMLLSNFVRSTPFLGIALLAVIIGFIGGMVRVVAELRVPDLPPAVVCANDQKAPYQGLLIGETDTAVYLGQRYKHRVVSIPKDRLGELWIGPVAVRVCSFPKSTS